MKEELEKQALIMFNNTTNIPPMLQALRIYYWKDQESIRKFTTCFIRLTFLVIEDCRGVESFLDLQDLVSLKHLKILRCPSMDGPPPLAFRRNSGGGVSVGVWPPKLDSLNIGYLKSPISEWGPLPTSLVELTLWDKAGSSLAEEDNDVNSFPTSLLPYSLPSSLTELKLIDFKKMERISGGLQHLTSLQHLFINLCPNIMDLPETLLPSLLRIFGCKEELKEKILSKILAPSRPYPSSRDKR